MKMCRRLYRDRFSPANKRISSSALSILILDSAETLIASMKSITELSQKFRIAVVTHDGTCSESFRLGKAARYEQLPKNNV